MSGTLEEERPTASNTTHGAEAEALSPSLRQVGRRSIPWIVLAVIAVVVALLGILLSGRGAVSGAPLDPAGAAPAGAKAVVEVLRQQGVTVVPVTTMQQVRDRVGDDPTVLVFDPDGNLDANGYDSLASTAASLVVVEPDYTALQQLAPGVSAGGRISGTGSIAADCTVPAAVTAERIDPHPTGNTEGTTVPGSFRLGDGDATGCFPSDSGLFSLVQTTADGNPLTLVGSAAILMNDSVGRAGNAALALTLLGQHRTLVWYQPSLLDRPVTGPPDLSALTPGWVTPVVLLLILVFVAAAFWRGRRFGPLVVENLPVVVRAGETREGRARLYQRSSARLRAADALRIGTLGRLAGLVGLPQSAPVTEIVEAVAALTRRDRNAVRGVLLDSVPRTDADLLALSDTLAELERATATAVTPDSPGPTGRMDA
ncbi:DUF4350 domain-containing protein [Leifsonia poae]|uniref:DUF4350 domain-containing protein n=1 Tax=Leifsonia poae TaxID=110933 RepID=UPI001CBB2DFB|nr:DUF4350 domain-containing protein [Leifsonia poae]